MKKGLVSILGPGLLYAGAAVGVSHLVQSTRAGATFGAVMIVVAVLTNIIKYPFFEYGPRYTAATGKNLLHGYADLGKWAIAVFIFLMLGTVFTVQAAVTIVTAGLFNALTGLSFSPIQSSAFILVVCMAILWIGRYKLVDRVMKVIILTLSVTTLITLIMALWKMPEMQFEPGSFSFLEPEHIAFLVAFIGWMPAPFDVAVLHSIWSESKNRDENKRTVLKDALTDFHVGYWGTLLLAVCFVGLGAAVLHGSGVQLSESGAQFSKQLIQVYTTTIGSWAKPFILIAAFSTMFSTTLAILDGFSRVFVVLGEMTYRKPFNKTYYQNAFRFSNLLLAIGAVIVLVFLQTSMRGMVDFATTLSFITAPVLAFLNFKVVHSSGVEDTFKPKKSQRIFAQIGLVILAAFSFFFLYFKFVMG